jgi:hypothetical protein
VTLYFHQHLHGSLTVFIQVISLEFVLNYKRMFTIVFLSNYRFMPVSTFYHCTYLLKLILTQQLTFCFVIFFQEMGCNMYGNNLGNTMDEPMDSVT